MVQVYLVYFYKVHLNFYLVIKFRKENKSNNNYHFENQRYRAEVVHTPRTVLE